MLITTHSCNRDFKLNNTLKNRVLREKPETEDLLLISFAGMRNKNISGVIDDSINIGNIDSLALAPEDEVNLNANKIIGLFKTLFDTSEINFSLKKCINLTYKKFDVENKKLLEDAILNMMKTTKDLNFIKFGATFFFNKDENKDKDFQKLTDLVSKLNSFDPQEGTEYLKTREALFKQEALITFQEVMEPEKYLDRSVKMNVFHDGFPVSHKEALLKLRTRSLNALAGVLLTNSRLNIKNNNNFNELLTDDILNCLNKIKNYDQNEKLIINSINVLKFIFDDLKQAYQYKAQSTIYKIYNQSTNKNVSDKASLFIQTTSKNNLDNKKYLKEIEEQLVNNYNIGDKSDKIHSLLVLAQINSSKAQDITKIVLTDNNISPELKRTAIWTAGICKNSENFELLCELINPNELFKLDNLSSDEIELTELILYSIAQYSDENTVKVINKVIDAINTINKQENKPFELKQSLSDISETAETLINKIQKTEDKQKDFYIKKHLDYLNNNQVYLKEKIAYEELRNRCVPGFNTFSPDLQNYLDNILLPFRNFLNGMVSIGKKIYIINDTITSIDKDDRGKRTYTNFYGDNAGGLTSNGNIIIPCKSSKDSYNIATTIGHEWGHIIHFSIMNSQPEIAEKIENLYRKALEKDCFMDFYSKTNAKEYFAQANEAYLSIYKPYDYLAVKDDYNNHFSNTRSKLRRKDPEMFKLLDDLYNENSKVNLTHPLDLVA